MQIWEAVLKAFWGTDAKCETEHAESDRMLAEVEAKVEQLQRTLDERPARNLDEAVYDMSQRRRG